MPAADEEDLTGGAGGVYRKVVRPPNPSVNRPPHGADVTVHYEGFLLTGQKFDSSRDRDTPFSFKLGVGQVIEGWDLAVAAMTPGEVDLVTIRSDYAYGWEGTDRIPQDATLRFEIELISWTPGAKAIAEMSPTEQLTHGQERREAGITLLKAGEHEQAGAAFCAAVESFSSLHVAMRTAVALTPDPDRLAEVVAGLRSCLLNLAQCDLKMQRWERLEESSSRVLELDPPPAQSVKALYRRGIARGQLQRLEEARVRSRLPRPAPSYPLCLSRCSARC